MVSWLPKTVTSRACTVCGKTQVLFTRGRKLNKPSEPSFRHYEDFQTWDLSNVSHASCTSLKTTAVKRCGTVWLTTQSGAHHNTQDSVCDRINTAHRSVFFRCHLRYICHQQTNWEQISQTLWCVIVQVSLIEHLSVPSMQFPGAHWKIPHVKRCWCFSMPVTYCWLLFFSNRPWQRSLWGLGTSSKSSWLIKS